MPVMKISGFESTIDWYDANAETYAENYHPHNSGHEVAEFCSYLQPGDSVLDAGCAAGRDAHKLAEFGLEVLGVDASEGLISEGQKRYPNLNFKVQNFLDLSDVPGNSLQGIFAHASLLHLDSIEDVKQALAEFCRVLALDGILFVKVKAQTGDKVTDVVSDKLSGHERFFRYFNLEDLAPLLQKAGFEIMVSRSYNEVERLGEKGRPEVDWIEIIGKKK